MPPASFSPDLPTLAHLGLALAVGLFVGFERERRGKEAGVRTFGFAALLGCLGGLLGESYALISLALLSVLTILLNLQALRANEGIKLTTSAALLVTGFAGILSSQGHTLTTVALGVITAALLAWKEHLAGFSLGLTEAEIRSAILLAILAFVIYPALPPGAIDPWGLVEPRQAWVTVILIAAIGFANYLLLKRYGTHGIEVTGFLGGLVNSSVTVTELATKVHDTQGGLADLAFRGVVLATAAMVLRNALLLGILAPQTFVSAALPLTLMLVSSGGLLLLHHKRPKRSTTLPQLQLASPFSIRSALKFGVLFLGLQIADVIAQRVLGQPGFYAVSLLGGLISSASAVASAATLALHGTITPQEAGIGAVLASLVSALVNLPLVARLGHDRQLTKRVAWVLGAIVGVGVIGIIGQATVLAPMIAQH